MQWQYWSADKQLTDSIAAWPQTFYFPVKLVLDDPRLELTTHGGISAACGPE